MTNTSTRIIKSIAIVVIGVFALSFLASGVARAEHSEDLQWQRGNSLQNVYENHVLWGDLTNELDEEFLATDDRGLSADLMGEALAVTLDYITAVHGYPFMDNCHWEVAFAAEESAMGYLLAYAASYYWLSADVGLGTDVEHFWDYAYATEQDYFDRVPNKCFAKLDV